MKLTITFTLPDTFARQDVELLEVVLRDAATQCVAGLFKDMAEKESNVKAKMAIDLFKQEILIKESEQ